jgi:hypothetical protein
MSGDATPGEAKIKENKKNLPNREKLGEKKGGGQKRSEITALPDDKERGVYRARGPRSLGQIHTGI